MNPIYPISYRMEPQMNLFLVSICSLLSVRVADLEMLTTHDTLLPTIIYC